MTNREIALDKAIMSASYEDSTLNILGRAKEFLAFLDGSAEPGAPQAEETQFDFDTFRYFRAASGYLRRVLDGSDTYTYGQNYDENSGTWTPSSFTLGEMESDDFFTEIFQEGA